MHHVFGQDDHWGHHCGGSHHHHMGQYHLQLHPKLILQMTVFKLFCDCKKLYTKKMNLLIIVGFGHCSTSLGKLEQ